MYEVLSWIGIDDPDNHARRSFFRGELLYKYLGETYGAISENGAAISENGSLEPPFHQVPKSKVREVE